MLQYIRLFFLVLSPGASPDQLSDEFLAAKCGSNYCPAKLVEEEETVVETIVSNLTGYTSKWSES